MVLNIDTIRSLEVGKTYYLANSTGQIKKEADIANRFAVANADKIASTEAGGIAAKRIHAAVKDSIRSCLHREVSRGLARRCRTLPRARREAARRPSPMKDAGGRHRVLDADAFEKPLADILDGASNVRRPCRHLRPHRHAALRQCPSRPRLRHVLCEKGREGGRKKTTNHPDLPSASLQNGIKG